MINLRIGTQNLSWYLLVEDFHQESRLLSFAENLILMKIDRHIIYISPVHHVYGMLHLIYLLTIDMESNIHTRIFVQIHRVFQHYCNDELLSLADMKFRPDMGVEWLTHEFFVKQKHPLHRRCELAVICYTVMRKRLTVAMVLNLCIHIRKITTDHFKSRIVIVSATHISVQTLTHILLKRIGHIKINVCHVIFELICQALKQCVVFGNQTVHIHMFADLFLEKS